MGSAKMRTTFQIIFCLLSVACIVAAVFLGVFFGLLYCLIAVLGALVFAALMLLMKNGNPLHREKRETTDFMNSDEVNQAILSRTQDRTDPDRKN